MTGAVTNQRRWPKKLGTNKCLIQRQHYFVLSHWVQFEFCRLDFYQIGIFNKDFQKALTKDANLVKIFMTCPHNNKIGRGVGMTRVQNCLPVQYNNHIIIPIAIPIYYFKFTDTIETFGVHISKFNISAKGITTLFIGLMQV